MTSSNSSFHRQWPSRPDLHQFKRQAKELLKAYRAGEHCAVAEVKRHERDVDPAVFALHDAQRVLARSYGFASWRKLKNYVETLRLYWRPLEPKRDDDANEFLGLACLTYFDEDHPSRRARARQMLAAAPQLAQANLYAAAAVGDVAAAGDFITNGADVTERGGPFNWPPLLYAAYSRLDSEAAEHSTLEVARLLIERGADPNAGFLQEGGYLFTALTGALGLGESDVHRVTGPFLQPMHQEWRAFARLLLEAGADPNDFQGLYNRMQYPDDEHLKLLFEYGLGQDRGGPWFERFFKHWPSRLCPRCPADMLAYQLHWAIGAGYVDRVKLLVENGVSVREMTVGQYDADPKLIDYLVAKGARLVVRTLTPAEEIAAALHREDSQRVRELAASDPALLDNPELFRSAAEEGRIESLRLLVDLGMNVDGKAGYPWPNDTSPLWWAAHAGHLDAVKWLVEGGADVHFRDPNYHATPLASANYKGHREVVDYLLQFATIHDAVRFGGLDRLHALLSENPESAKTRDDRGRTLLHYLQYDTPHGPEIVELLCTHGADPSATDNDSRTAAAHMLQIGRPELASVVR